MNRCGRCGETKPPDEFGFRHKASGRRHSVCKGCQRVYTRRYHRKDPAGYNRARNARMVDYRERNRSVIAAYLRRGGCVDCGERDPVVLEFDHVRGRKRKAIAVMVGEAVSLSTLLRELAKCVVRCANCHRRRTAEARGYWKAGGQERPPGSRY